MNAAQPLSVSVTLGSGLHRYGPTGTKRSMRVPPGARIADLLAALGFQDAEPLLVARNGRVAAPEDPLEENDMVWVFPAVGGGA